MSAATAQAASGHKIEKKPVKFSNLLREYIACRNGGSYCRREMDHVSNVDAQWVRD